MNAKTPILAIENLKVGMTAEYSRQVTGADISSLCRGYRRSQPVHLDEAYAASSQFGKRIAHGILSVGFSRRYWALSCQGLAAFEPKRQIQSPVLSTTPCAPWLKSPPLSLRKTRNPKHECLCRRQARHHGRSFNVHSLTRLYALPTSPLGDESHCAFCRLMS